MISVCRAQSARPFFSLPKKIKIRSDSSTIKYGRSVSTEELRKALASLQAALALPKTDITRDASIQRFEFTIELAWKTAKKKMGSISSAPKVVVREMAQAQLIDDPNTWFEFLEARNLTLHTYKEEVAEKVFAQAGKFSVHCDELLKKLAKMP